MKLGVQLYGCMKDFRKDPEGFFRGLAEAGYTQAEPCVALGSSGEELEKNGVNPVWLPAETEGFCRLMRENGLELSSCHIFGDPLAHFEELRRFVISCGVRQIVLNFPEGDLVREYSAFADRCLTLASRLREIGAGLLLHNSFPEVRLKIGGQSILELALERCEGAVGVQVDVGWALYGGEEPVEYLKRLAPYLRSLHYKDLKPGYRSLPVDQAHTCLGDGCLDVKSVFEYTKPLGIPQLVDQDSSADFLRDLTRSAALLRALHEGEPLKAESGASR